MLYIKILIKIWLAFIATSRAQSPFSTRSRLPGPSSPAGSMALSTQYIFTGVSGQFAKFPRWFASQRVPGILPGSQSATSLSFEFRTRNSRSFLVYLDDGGDTSYISLTLSHGEVNLRFKFGRPKTVILRAGANLNDNAWHTVTVERNFPSITLTVDGNSTTGSVVRLRASKFVPSSHTYFGGLPRSYRIQLLALPGVYYHDKFVGNIRKISMNGHHVTHMEKLGVWEENTNPLCSTYRNPCSNNGVCFVNSQKKVECDCSKTNYTGDFCDEESGDAVANFRGSQWLSYDISPSRPISSIADEITLAFRTRYSNGLILHTGKSPDYAILSLENSKLVLVINLGSGAYEIVVEAENGGFDDGEWHYVRVNRTLQQVSIVVDQAIIYNSYTQDDFTQLTLDDKMYVGGSPSKSNLPGLKNKNNFIGCLKEVTYSNSKLRRILISRWARDRDERVAVYGDVEFSCSDPDVSGPVNFATPDSWLIIQTTNNGYKGSIEFSFRTSESNGLLLYSNSTSSDLLAIELHESDIFVIINLGTGTSRFRITSSPGLADGTWHRLKVARNGKNLTTAVDGVVHAWRITGLNSNLDLSKNLFLGGTDFGDRFRPLADLWTAPLRQGFVGCIRDFRKDGKIIDIQSLAKSRSAASASSPDDITPFCKGLGQSQCASTPCKNNGVCTEGMDRFICDCSNTAYMGGTCEKAVVASRFNGSQGMTFPMAKTVQTKGEDISLRFRTPVSTGILFATTSNNSKDSLIIELVKGGQIKLLMNIDCSSKNCTAPRQGPDVMLEGNGLNDRQWHRVKVYRRGRRVSLDVDGRRKANILSGNHNKLEFDIIHLGKIVTSQQNTVANSSTNMLGSSAKPFVGHLENVVFNTVHLIDSCADGNLVCNNNSSFGDTGVIVSYPVSFEDDDSYVMLSTLQAYNSMELFLSLKTTVKNGLILYNGGRNGDYIAVEMVEGKVFYLYNTGNGDQVLSMPGSRTVNDNTWHDVKILRNEKNFHTMLVDGVPAYNKGSSQRRNLDLDGHLYIGGVRQDMFRNENFPRNIASRVGFQGCLGNIDLNGKIPDISGRDKISSVGVVLGGCRGPTQSCSNASCSNGGICQQQWNDFICDCSMTTYVGKTCQNRATTYRFGANSGLMLYRWMDNYPSSRDDSFALGFSTTQRNALLMRVTGSTSTGTQDFLELKIENGRMTLRFNIGGDKDVVLYEPSSVSDGQYHKCIVSRHWMNATITVDNQPDRTHVQTEQTSSVFNSQSTILIGGMTDIDLLNGNSKSPTITQAFRGQMVGFFYNDVRVFDLAADDDSQVEIFGDIELIGRPSSLPPTFPTISQPITIMATLTTFATTKSTIIVDPAKKSPCDDEDLKLCPNSSGSGEGSGEVFVDDETIMGTKSREMSPTNSIVKITNADNMDALTTEKPLIDFLVEIGFVAQVPVATAMSQTENEHQISQESTRYVDEPAEAALVESLVTPSVRSQSKDGSTDAVIGTTSNDESDWLEILSLFEEDIIYNEDDKAHTDKMTLHPPNNLGNKSNETTAAGGKVMGGTTQSIIQSDIKNLHATARSQDLASRIKLDSNTSAFVSTLPPIDRTASFHASEPGEASGLWDETGGKETTVSAAVAGNEFTDVVKIGIKVDLKRKTSLISDPVITSREMTNRNQLSSSSTTPSSTLTLTTPSPPNLPLSHAFGGTEPTPNVTVAGSDNKEERGGSIKVSETPERPPVILKQEAKTSSVSFDSATTKSLDDPSLFTEIYTGSVPIMIGEAASLSMSMIIGIASAAFVCVLVLIFIVYRCRTRDAVYNVTKQERSNGMTPKKSKHITITTNGNIIREKTTVSNHDPDKEVFV